MKSKLLLLLLPAACLASCSVKQVIEDMFAPSTTNNYDSDPVVEIETDTSSTEYDKEIEEEKVETPDEYTGENVTSITASGNYSFEGEINAIDIKKNLEVYLFFNGVTINSTSGIALGTGKDCKVHIVLQNGSNNTIINDVEDENAIHIKGDLFISGHGTLNIESKQKNGLKVTKDINVSGENVILNVTGANHAIAGRSITVNKSVVNVVSKAKDGFQLECDATEFTKEEGYAYFVDAKVTADTQGDRKSTR